MQFKSPFTSAHELACAVYQICWGAADVMMLKDREHANKPPHDEACNCPRTCCKHDTDLWGLCEHHPNSDRKPFARGHAAILEGCLAVSGTVV